MNLREFLESNLPGETKFEAVLAFEGEACGSRETSRFTLEDTEGPVGLLWRFGEWSGRADSIIFRSESGAQCVLPLGSGSYEEICYPERETFPLRDGSMPIGIFEDVSFVFEPDGDEIR